jgi:hypothetical protein
VGGHWRPFPAHTRVLAALQDLHAHLSSFPLASFPPCSVTSTILLPLPLLLVGSVSTDGHADGPHTLRRRPPWPADEGRSKGGAARRWRLSALARGPAAAPRGQKVAAAAVHRHLTGCASSMIPDAVVVPMVAGPRRSPELPLSLRSDAKEMGGVRGPAPGATSIVREKIRQ